jgi:hypothetical protein
MRIELYNLIGEKIHSESYLNQQEYIIENLSAGFYELRLISNRGVIFRSRAIVY